MKIGYACINTELDMGFKTCRLATAKREGWRKLKQLTLHNLEVTRQILLWNYSNDILFYRLTSNLIPFASHEINDWKWWKDEDVIEATKNIRIIKQTFGLRLSMHPPQFTALSTPRKEVLENALKDLEWHGKLMEMIDGDDLILHGGGAYGDITEASKRFANEYNNLPHHIKSRLRLENDDKTYSLKDVLYINSLCDVPICLDIHHHNCHNNNDEIDFEQINNTWKGFGTPKVHISTGYSGKTDNKHHDFIHQDDYNELLKVLDGYDADIMFEAKAKQKAVKQYIY